jgi:hypothetical protein
MVSLDDVHVHDVETRRDPVSLLWAGVDGAGADGRCRIGL